MSVAGGLKHSGPSKPGLFIAGFTGSPAIASAGYDFSIACNRPTSSMAGSKPSRLVVASQDDRHSVVNCRRQLVRLRGDDGDGKQFAVSCIPDVPDAGEPEQFVALQMEVNRHLLLVDGPPFVEPVGRHDAVQSHGMSFN